MELQVFENNDFGRVRTIEKDGDPWFVAKDVCECLKHSNPSMAIQGLDEDERAKESLGRQGSGWIISESGLYSLIMRSNLPSSKQFRKWVTGEVLPALRKTGQYTQPLTFEERTIALIGEAQTRIKALENKIEEDRPITEFGRAISESAAAVKIGDWVKAIYDEEGVKIGRNRFFNWLREQKYLMLNNRPYQRYVDQGLFEVKEGLVVSSKGPIPTFTTLLTGKGQMYFLNKLLQFEEEEAA